MATKKDIRELVEDVIEINCMDCKEFWKPLATSECLCMPIDEILDTDPEVKEWERQQKKLKKVYAKED